MTSRAHPRLDEWPFCAFGAQGAFAFGVLDHARGDGERAAWTVLPALRGLVMRPPPKGNRDLCPHRPTAEDHDYAERLQLACVELHQRMLDRVLPGLAATFRSKRRLRTYRGEVKAAGAAWHGYDWPHGMKFTAGNALDKLRPPASDGAYSMVRYFGCAVPNPDDTYGPKPSAFWQAIHAAEYLMAAVPVMGEDAWQIVEQFTSAPVTPREVPQ